MKHGLKVKPDGFVANFVSNMSFFTRYKYIIGMTGTLGSKSSK